MRVLSENSFRNSLHKSLFLTNGSTYSFSLLPVFFLLPLFGAVPGFVRLFLLVVLLFALGQDCAVVRMVLRVG